jgi:hypothetical protein
LSGFIIDDNLRSEYGRQIQIVKERILREQDEKIRQEKMSQEVHAIQREDLVKEEPLGDNIPEGTGSSDGQITFDKGMYICYSTLLLVSKFI